MTGDTLPGLELEGVEGFTAAPAVGRCPRCRRGVAVEYDAARDAGWVVKSGCCSRWTNVSRVDGARSSRECGGHCEDATGRTCRCECGGIRHGLTWRTAVSS